jgi:hypothetical protein
MQNNFFESTHETELKHLHARKQELTSKLHEVTRLIREKTKLTERKVISSGESINEVQLVRSEGGITRIEVLRKDSGFYPLKYNVLVDFGLLCEAVKSWEEKFDARF